MPMCDWSSDVCSSDLHLILFPCKAPNIVALTITRGMCAAQSLLARCVITALELTLRCILVCPVELRATLPLRRWGLIPSDMRMEPQTLPHQTQSCVPQLAAGRLRVLDDEHRAGASPRATLAVLCTFHCFHACNAGDLGSIPGLGRSPGGGHGNPLKYSCLENPLGRGTWRATVHGDA